VEVFYLCMKEVPEYLQSVLCKMPPNAKLFPHGFQDRSDNTEEGLNPMYQLGRYTYKSSRPQLYRLDRHGNIETQTRAYETTMQDGGAVSVRHPPKPYFQFVQDNQYVSTTTPVSVKKNEDNLIKSDDYKLDELSAPKINSSPFAFVAQDEDPGIEHQIVYSVAQSKVAVYSPQETTTTKEPSTRITMPLTTAKPFHYQKPKSENYYKDVKIVQKPPNIPFHRKEAIERQRVAAKLNRPLLYTKKKPDKEVGPQVSKPFEYLTRLSSFLSDQVRGIGRTTRRSSGQQVAINRRTKK